MSRRNATLIEAHRLATQIADDQESFFLATDKQSPSLATHFKDRINERMTHLLELLEGSPAPSKAKRGRRRQAEDTPLLASANGESG